MLEGKEIKGDPFKRLEGGSVGLSWLEEEEDAMTEPIVIEKPEGLGMQMPPEDFGIEDVAQIVGEDTPIEVIGIAPLIMPHKNSTLSLTFQMLPPKQLLLDGHSGNGQIILNLNLTSARRY